MKLLLHICCAPCLIYPLEILRGKSIEVSGFFYNPNIQPLGEYTKRMDALVKFNDSANINIAYPKYMPAEFVSEIESKEDNASERCPACWSLRLRTTAKAAKQGGVDSFSTTLLVSPYQNHELLKEIGDKISKEEGITFYYDDFRPGFKKAREQAKAQGIYCQKYCGCVYSEDQQCKKSLKP